MAISNILEVNQRFMHEMGIYFHSSGRTKSFNEHRQSAVSYLILFSLLIGILLSVIKIYQTNEFSEKSYTLMVFIAMSQAFDVFLNIRLKRKNASALDHKLQSIVADGLS